ncbi:hypothetical protein GCM10017744_081460 [Streptomyces antimycoticus]|uniref:Uncharacterized protein n=1 Tax=Streptomyces antimycoticus TaxID=68175 RepID=A0A4D4K464_9ACTN|nr:hypothetical protein [Streptomyces antimycoticus]GDY41107.1 hypothetical protein SANT12839_019890 [Streptomyces antimycoticus]
MENILGDFGPARTPHDLYTGDLLSTRATLASGVTTIQDVSDIQNTPEHSDALVTALREIGALLPGTTFMHANGLSTEELAVIADSGGSQRPRPRPWAHSARSTGSEAG